MFNSLAPASYFENMSCTHFSVNVYACIVYCGSRPCATCYESICYIIKDKNKRVNDKRNYRPICLSNICSKIIEVLLFNNRISTFLQTDSNQFGFKPKHGTELCVFAFKELLHFYKKNMVLP